MKKYLLIQISNPILAAFKHSLRLITLTAFLSLYIISALAQSAANNISLSGKVVDEKTKTPLEGATVHIKGTTHEVVTDKAGEFRFITGQKVPVIYSVSFVGYQMQEFPVSETTGVQLELKEATNQMNEVVVVGYGIQSSKSLIGAITKVHPSQTKNIPGMRNKRLDFLHLPKEFYEQHKICEFLLYQIEDFILTNTFKGLKVQTIQLERELELLDGKHILDYLIRSEKLGKHNEIITCSILHGLIADTCQFLQIALFSSLQLPEKSGVSQEELNECYK